MTYYPDSIITTMSATERTYTVKQLTSELRIQLEHHYTNIQVEGEISGLALPGSGHIYFSLKEESAIIRCAFFRNRNRKLSFTPENGLQVTATGQISLYENRGDLQLIVTNLSESGEGALAKEFERLKKALHSEGLFASEHKQPIPDHPTTIAIVSSSTGAALQDILVTLKRRFPIAHIQLFPTAVQGAEAIPGIEEMLNRADQVSPDVIILARGGGSLEDLQAFNSEPVARAIFACKTPIVSGIGHEIDFTIADMVADYRAPTPTGAAEAVSPDGLDIKRQLSRLHNHLITACQRQLNNIQQNLDFTVRNIEHPQRRIKQQTTELNHLNHRLSSSLKESFNRRQMAFQSLKSEIRQHTPTLQLSRLKQQNDHLQSEIIRLITSKISTLSHHRQSKAENLSIMNPQNTLDRGYAILTDNKNQVITHAHNRLNGQSIKATVSDGSLTCLVESSNQAN